MDQEQEDQNTASEENSYYTFLNIPRDACQEEINMAYRRLSRLYHPDKHVDPDRKKEAETLFNKTKVAYEVLSDPDQRAIYDTVGVEGLCTRGWEVVQRTRSPQEIREEYEKLLREKEERRLQQATNPKSSITININATELFDSYDDDDDDEDEYGSGLPSVEVSGISITQSVEAPLTLKNTAVLSGDLSTTNGYGSGHVSCCLRRLVSATSWAEVEASVGTGLVLSLRGFRQMGRHLHATGHGFVHILPNGLGRCGVIGTLGYQLDRHTVGYLTYQWTLSPGPGPPPAGVRTMVVRETEHTRLSASLFVGLPHSHITGNLLLKLPEADLRARLMARLDTAGFLLEYGLEKKISSLSSLAAVLSLGAPSGIALKLRLKRASQTYTANVRLSDELLLSPVFYGSVVPLVTWAAISLLIVAPYLKQKEREESEKRRWTCRERTAARRREAQAAVDLMRETVSRNRQTEETRRGLIVTAAWYGRLVLASSGDHADPAPDDIIDVTVPLQCLVSDSKLILQTGTKAHLPGFYDPVPDTEKSLQVEYLFHGVRHQVTVADTDPLRIPKSSHRVES